MVQYVLDFSKAFYKVPHHHLLHKIEYYGITSTTLKCIEAITTGRTQRVVVDVIHSDLAPVDSGDPQGTVLGPLLFLLFINNITEKLSSTIRSFADDCLLYNEIKSASDTVALQEDRYGLPVV